MEEEIDQLGLRSKFPHSGVRRQELQTPGAEVELCARQPGRKVELLSVCMSRSMSRAPVAAVVSPTVGLDWQTLSAPWHSPRTNLRRDRQSGPSHSVPCRQHLHALPSNRRRAGSQAGQDVSGHSPWLSARRNSVDYDGPPTRQSPPSADHVEHYFSMTLSKCYRESQGQLSCVTCHDSHVEPSREEAGNRSGPL
jgi:hypothetical protein